MLTSKQRAQLRAIGGKADTILHVGKGGINENLIRQADDALTARELVKGRVLENSLLTPREVADVLCEELGCDCVQTIGTRFVLYRPNPKNPKIVLEK